MPSKLRSVSTGLISGLRPFPHVTGEVNARRCRHERQYAFVGGHFASIGRGGALTATEERMPQVLPEVSLGKVG